MYIVKEKDEYVFETWMLVDALFNPDDKLELRRMNVQINRLAFTGITVIRIKQNTSNEDLGKCVKMILKNYTDRR